ncbi:MAG: terminase large subunit [Chlorobiaceae bacterium]|nr:terminase large subunit [Chlorobiaceae bacterium]
MTYADKIAGYCSGVSSGEIPSCEFIRLAVQRHTGDLARQDDKDFPYYWDQDAADRFLGFAEAMTHIKGEWRGRQIVMEPWQCFAFGVPFGWVRKSDDLRRYREIYAEIARKNGKSQIGAIIGNYMLLADGEGAPEVYSGATSEKQAHFVYDPAWMMINNDEELRKHFDINLTGSRDNPTGIHCRSNGGKFLPIIGNPGDGASPSCAIVDEYHEHPTPVLYETMKTGMGARRQPMMPVITTAGTDTSAPCYTARGDAIDVLRGTMQNDRLWAVVYTIDSEDDWTDFNVWAKANPNIGVSVFEDYLQAQLHEATTKAEKQNIIKCKHLNVWSNSGQAWINMKKFGKCGEDLNEDDFLGEECALGLDLAKVIDICAYARMFKQGDRYHVLLKYYLPEDTVNLIENAHLQQWAAEGLITVTPGARTDYDYILEDVKADTKKYEIRGLGYDAYNALHLIQGIQKEMPKLTCIEVPMSPKHISPPMKEMEAIIYDGKFVFDKKDKVLIWMFANAMLKSTVNKNYFLSKENPKSKIDGVMASILGLVVWLKDVKGSVASIYERQGVRML